MCSIASRWESGLSYYIDSERLSESGSSKRNGSNTKYIERTLSSAKLLHQAGGERDAHPLPHETVLSLFRDPNDPTPMNALANALSDIRIFHAFDTGPFSQARRGTPIGSAKTYLSDGGENLALVLKDLEYCGELGPINQAVQTFWENADGVRILLEGAVARTDIQEKGSKTPTPGLRLSDGTLKFLCLMAVLLHPRPPALICIEEPELGLHPDSMMIVANALREASKRCQVLVTTHSAELVSWFSSSPETVVVCEREPREGTQFNRLKPSIGLRTQKGRAGGQTCAPRLLQTQICSYWPPQLYPTHTSSSFTRLLPYW